MKNSSCPFVIQIAVLSAVRVTWLRKLVGPLLCLLCANGRPVDDNHYHHLEEPPFTELG